MQWERALISLAEMRDVGIKANSFVYSAAIDACAKVQNAPPLQNLVLWPTLGSFLFLPLGYPHGD